MSLVEVARIAYLDWHSLSALQVILQPVKRQIFKLYVKLLCYLLWALDRYPYPLDTTKVRAPDSQFTK